MPPIDLLAIFQSPWLSNLRGGLFLKYLDTYNTAIHGGKWLDCVHLVGQCCNAMSMDL